MTTNAGAEQMAKRSIGFSRAGDGERQPGGDQALFTPEFRNRLSRHPVTRWTRSPSRASGTVILDWIAVGGEGVTIDINERRATGWRSMATTRRWVGVPCAGHQGGDQEALAEELLFGKLEHGGTCGFTVATATPLRPGTEGRACGERRRLEENSEEEHPTQKTQWRGRNAKELFGDKRTFCGLCVMATLLDVFRMTNKNAGSAGRFCLERSLSGRGR